MKLLERLVPQLARAIAPMCEVVLHSNISSPPTIRAIGNGHVTNRSVGDLMTKIHIDGRDVSNSAIPLFNYVSELPDGRKIRVSLIPVLDREKVIAYIAVNFLIQDFSSMIQMLNLITQAEPRTEIIHETFTSPKKIIQEILEEYLFESARSINSLRKKQRIELIDILSKRGVFSMRHAVDEVAQALGVSRSAVYNYMSELALK